MRHPDTNKYFKINELRFKGYTILDTSADVECEVTVGESIALADKLTFLVAGTPTLESITPKSGTTLGGTTVTLQGQHFGTE